MNKVSPVGFLVVLGVPEYTNARNLRYKGVDRVPAYPSDIPMEMKVLEDYVFGNYKDPDTNLIEDYQRARELWQRLNVSPRPFQILAWCSGDDDSVLKTFIPESELRVPLGYDVAGISGDCWSIVDDMPDKAWAEPYVAVLNDNGLFPTREIAKRYLADYVDHQEADCNVNFAIGFVVQVIPSEISA